MVLVVYSAAVVFYPRYPDDYLLTNYTPLIKTPVIENNKQYYSQNQD